MMKRKNYWYLLTLVMVTMLSMGLASCGDDDDDNGGSHPSSLVGVWGQNYDNVGVLGFKLDKNGTFAYDEWMYNEMSDFSNMKATINWSVSGSTLKLSAKGYDDLATWTFTLSEDGKTLYLSNHEGEHYDVLVGAFTKMQ